MAVPGLKKFKADFIAAIKTVKNDFDSKIGNKDEPDPMGTTGTSWVLPESSLQNWPITEAGWKLFRELVEKHGWRGHSKSRYKELNAPFREYETAKAGYDEKDKSTYGPVISAGDALSNALKEWKFAFKKPSDKDYPGFERFRDGIKERVDKEVSNLKLKSK